jgi:hypothetical protein
MDASYEDQISGALSGLAEVYYLDGDGDILAAIGTTSVTFIIDVFDYTPVLKLRAFLVSGCENDGSATEVLNRLNAAILFGAITWGGSAGLDHLFYDYAMLIGPSSNEHIRTAVKAFAEQAVSIDTSLAQRYGGITGAEWLHSIDNLRTRIV